MLPIAIEHIGFTGTSRGMTQAQKDCVKNELETFLIACTPEDLEPTEDIVGDLYFHHGDCVGADEQSHDLAVENVYHIVIHPPTENKHRAWCDSEYMTMHEPKEYLERNRDIVDASEFMIATPATYDEVLRSGTWSTIRYARKTGKPLVIFLPDGREIRERCEQL